MLQVLLPVLLVLILALNVMFWGNFIGKILSNFSLPEVIEYLFGLPLTIIISAMVTGLIIFVFFKVADYFHRN